MYSPSHDSGSQEPDAIKKLCVLIVEDEVSLAQALRDSLEEQGFGTLVAHSVEAAWEALWATSPHLILLDVTLPEGEDAGFVFAQDLREADFRQPILFMTARETSPDEVRGLEPGDEHLAKPFAVAELVARLRALHSRGEHRPRAVCWDSFELLTGARQLHHEGIPVRLTAKEFEVLELFALNAGRIFTCEEVLERVWGYNYENPSSLVDVYVKNLCGKLVDGVIETVNGLGYRFSG